jgi:hypothetical protein
MNSEFSATVCWGIYGRYVATARLEKLYVFLLAEVKRNTTFATPLHLKMTYLYMTSLGTHEFNSS